VLNWEKCHFMVQEGIVLGHKISVRGIEVDKAKIDVIEKLPPPMNVKGVRSFLGHVGFYRRFIKDFSRRIFSQVNKCFFSIQGFNCFLGSSNLNGPDYLPSRKSDHMEQWSFMTLKLKIPTEHGW